MFTAINSVNDETIRKSEDEERDKLQQTYNKALLTLDIDSFLKQKPKHDINLGFYRKATNYLVFNYTFRKELKEIEPNISKYNLLSYREAVFNVARKNIEAENFIRARKLLNIAREKGFFCNTLYELEEQLEKEWYLKI